MKASAKIYAKPANTDAKMQQKKQVRPSQLTKEKENSGRLASSESDFQNVQGMEKVMKAFMV